MTRAAKVNNTKSLVRNNNYNNQQVIVKPDRHSFMHNNQNQLSVERPSNMSLLISS